MYSKYHIIKILGNCFQNMKCFYWTKLIPVMIHLKYWYYNSPQLQRPSLPHHLYQVLPQPTETLPQHYPHHVFHRFPYFVLPYSTTRHHKYWIYQTIWQSNSIKFFITLFTDHNTFWVKHATHQKVFDSRFSFKVGQQVQRQFDFQYKICWILYEMVGAPSF